MLLCFTDICNCIFSFPELTIAPTGLRPTKIGYTDVDVTWNQLTAPSPGNIDGYRVISYFHLCLKRNGKSNAYFAESLIFIASQSRSMRVKTLFSFSEELLKGTLFR